MCPRRKWDNLLELEHELGALTAQQSTLLDQALANMDDLTITEQLKTLLKKKAAPTVADRRSEKGSDQQDQRGFAHDGAHSLFR